jgi:hypothetical protein
MALKYIFALTVVILLSALSACNLPDPAIIAATNPSPADGTAVIQTEVARVVASTEAAQTQTAGMIASAIAVETQAAEIVASTMAAQTEVANSVASTLTAMITNTPEFTVTPSLTSTSLPTSTPTFTLTPDLPRVSVSVETNCRKGPGLVYEVLGVLRVGETAEIVGRDFGNGNWIIRLPSNPAIICWIWRNYATTTGDIAPVPVFTPEPTSTPSARFSVSYVDVTACAPQYAFHFQVDNTGSITWESIRIVITNNTASSTTTHTLDSFRSYEGCSVESNQQNLEPGEGGHVANINPGQFNYDPSGDQFTAVVTVCSENGLAGTCLSKTINFTP